MRSSTFLTIVVLLILLAVALGTAHAG